MINVTKAFLPGFEEYTSILKRAWDNEWLTNNGELVQELEAKLKKYLGTDYLLFTGNGTIVLQMALKGLNITKEVITTPFSYVATTNALLWEGCTPVFVDIDAADFCIDANKIEEAITKDTEAILATHVYGMPCNIQAIHRIAAKHDLKVIYDGAHAFGTEYLGKQVLEYGDISTCSFHATKLYHTVEGGCIISHDPELFQKLLLLRSFGHIGDDYFSMGINGKNSEFHAAMGLANFPHLPSIIQQRKLVCSQYKDTLKETGLRFISYDPERVKYNYGYFPVVFDSEDALLKVIAALAKHQINARRYFNPSLNTLSFLKVKYDCPISEDISKRVLCLPLYAGLKECEVGLISSIINKTLKG